MKRKLVFLPMVIAYSLVIAAIRIFFFVADHTGLPEPKVFVGGLHLHHYLFGVAIMTLVALSSIHKKFPRSLLAFFFGVSLAFIIDEFQYLLRLAEFRSTPIELSTIGFVGFLLLTCAFFERFAKKKRLAIKHFPAMSVVVPVLNEEKILGRLLKSLKAQNYPGKVEIIIVDNGSTDESAKVAREYQAKVVTEPKVGVAFARQAGLLAASGQIVATTDADTIIPRNWLRTIACEFAKHPKVVAVSGMYDFYDGGLFLSAIIGIFLYPVYRIFDCASETNLAFKKAEFIKAGGFNTDFSYYETLGLTKKLKPFGQVLRLPFFKVKTSARRFKHQGTIGGLWSYIELYFRMKWFPNLSDKGFKAASQSSFVAPNFKKRLALATAVVFLLISFFSIPINPVHAKITHFIGNLENKLEKKIPISSLHINKPHRLIRHSAK